MSSPERESDDGAWLLVVDDQRDGTGRRREDEVLRRVTVNRRRHTH